MSAVEPGWVWDGVKALDYDHAAVVLGPPAGWLRKAVPAGEIPHSRYGKHVIFTPEDIAEIRRRHRVPIAGTASNDIDRSKLRAALRTQAA